MKSIFLSFVLGLVLAAAALGGCSSGADLPQMTLEQARADHDAARVTLIDVRESDEHARGVAAGAVLLPLSQLSRRMAEIPKNPEKPVYLVCNTQNRSQAALKVLKEQGYQNIYYVRGGMSEWATRGWPMVKP